jgi:[acyl-carrier-protein] S-malonyltransferase
MDANPASATLFPGQGVGDATSRELVADARPDLLDLATDLVGEDPFEHMAQGTAYAQPAVYCASIAGYERLGRPAAEYFAGHSLGEIGALAAAGAIDDADGLRIVVARGRAMDDVARAGEPGGMLAVGSDRDQAEALAGEHGLTLANENSPQQFVLSGPLARIEQAEAAAKGSGVRAKKLAVAPPTR